MELPTPLTRTLETAVNRYLGMDPACAARMVELEGRCIGIELRGTGMTFYIYPGTQGVRITDRADRPADTMLHGTPLAMARLGLGSNAGKTLFSGAATITGDVETGQTFQGILDDMDIDWEEQLSRLTGDIAAHQIGRAMRQAGKLLSTGRTTLEHDLGEYLQEELRVLPARIEVSNFCNEVDRIRADADRLEARIRRLQDDAEDMA
jgi:ubiquinone biosynthesis protein UbiJ